MSLSEYLYNHQQIALEEQKCHQKCLINMWCGTGKTRTFTMGVFRDNQTTNVIVFPSLGLIAQYCNDYILSHKEPFVSEFKKYKCLAFCSDDESKLKIKTDKIKYTTKEKTLNTFLKHKNDKIILVTYQSFEKFINQIIERSITINNLIFDEAHHIVGDKIQNIVFNNEELDECVEKTRYYTATPVNKNGITMYDRDEPDNSDCGPLAYEYLYYQAVEDEVCKSFETQICLYTQKKEYTNKYLPIFECIIRACLSGNYDYWNILTYHSFVNESENVNENVSFVKDFACKQNQDLVKKLFTKIQNEEFPHTKNLYSVDDVILKGVHSDTLNRQKTIDEFDKKVVGRIYILASCGILNEGIDTKWANMGVPINPTNSIVKESQRIGRVGRIPEENMPPAIILIPCMVDARKYASMDSAEQRDQMIREELSECGNFNTAMNVISAFKYQYDPELFEMCLMYPNKYAPQEVKSNLEKQGLIVEESKGDLLDNLSYVCEKEDIEIDKESFEGDNERDILNEIAELTEKTIEVHTQNHDEPIMYINGEVSDEEPLRLFYCEYDNTYAPIVKKDKTRNIKRKSTSPPKKRSRLFDVHTHPDLEVLWKISESSIDLNKSFSQGILDVDITWKEENWMEYYNILKGLNETPFQSFVTECGIKLGAWCNRQRGKKKTNKLSPDRIKLLEKIPGWFWELDLDKQWMEKYNILKGLNEMPSHNFVTESGIKLGNWCDSQRTKKKTNKLSPDRIVLLEKIPGWFWDLDKQWMEKYNILKGLNEMPSPNFVTECGVNICTWCSIQRREKKKNNLSQDRIELLEKIPGWFWDTDKLWMKNYNILKGLNEIPSHSFVSECGLNVGTWCGKQRYKKKTYKLSQDKINKLEKIPRWFWVFDLDKQWMENYNILKGLNEIPSHSFVTECGVNIGDWCSTQRSEKKKNNLSQDRIELLEKIPGWFWELDLNKQWNENYNILKGLNETPSQSFVTECGVNIGVWCSTQRAEKKKNKLSPDRIVLLEKIPGWFWEIDKQWNENYNILKGLNETPSQSFVTECGVNIGVWCGKQRAEKKKNKLSPDRIVLLEKIPGWFWELDLNKLWMENYNILKKFNKTPSRSFVTECDVKLVNWCGKQRAEKKKNNLSQDRIVLLEKIPGWFWDMDKQWMENYNILKGLNEIPSSHFVTECGVNIGRWCSKQRTKKKTNKLSPDRIVLLEKIHEWFWDMDNQWNENYNILKGLNETPLQKFVTECGINLGSWCTAQRTEKKKNKLSQDRIKKLEQIPGWFWEKRKKKKNMSKPEVKPKTPKETTKGKQPRVQSEMSLLHKEYKTKTSQNLHEYFKENPTKWEEYHKLSKDNEESFPDDEIPRNRMIEHLEGLPGKKKKIIADLGCGFAEINQHFKDNERFEFHNFDHHSSNEFVVSRDIKDTGLDDYSVDIAILSLAMWGSNCKEYLSESHRILDTCGTLLIVEAYKRWNKELDEYQKPINRLVKLLEENNFDVVKNNEQKFMFIECRKK